MLCHVYTETHRNNKKAHGMHKPHPESLSLPTAWQGLQVKPGFHLPNSMLKLGGVPAGCAQGGQVLGGSQQWLPNPS